MYPTSVCASPPKLPHTNGVTNGETSPLPTMDTSVSPGCLFQQNLGSAKPNLQRYQQRQTAHSGQVVARGEEQMFGVVREGRAEES